jgi:hypothetical protein
MGFLDEERKRLLNQKESGGSGNGSALSFLDRERTRLNTGLSLSPDGQSKLKAQQQRKTTVESKVPNIGDPTAALRNLPKQIQDGMAGPDPGPNASQEERDAWAMKKMKEDVAKIQREKNQKAAAPPAPAPQKNGFFDTIGNLFNPKSYSPDNIPKNLETPQLKPVREALGFAENTVDSATFGALPFAFDQARKIPGSQYLLNSQANTDITSRAAKAQEGTALGTTADLLGALVPYAGAYRATGGLARAINTGRGPIASNFVRGTLAGGAYGTANELGEAAFGKNDQSLPQRLQDIGISAALGGAGDAAVSAALPFLGRAAQKYLPGFRSTPDAPANPLALPPGRSPGVQNRMNAAAQRSVNAPGTNPIAEPYTFGLPSAARSVDDVLRAPDPQQLATSRSGARVNEEYQKLRASVQTQRAAGQPTPTNRELYEQAKARVDEVPEPVRPESPAVQAAQPQIAAPRTAAAPERPVATVESYDRALANGDTEAMRQIAPDIAEKMAAYPGDLSQIPTFLRGKMYNQLGINKRAPSNLPREADLAPEPNRTPEPRINAQTGPQPRNMVDQRVPMPNNSLLERPIVPREPAKIDPLIGNANPSTLGVGEIADNVQGIAARNLLPGMTEKLAYRYPLNDTRSHLRSVTDKPAIDYGKLGNKIYTDWVDDLFPIRQMTSQAQKVMGRVLEAGEDPYMMSLAARGSDMTSREILLNKFVNLKGEVVGDSFKGILSQLPKGRSARTDFEDYLLNKQAIFRFGQGEKVFPDRMEWTPQKAQDKIVTYDAQYPMFKKVADDLYGFQGNLLDLLVDGGVLSRAQKAAWIEANPEYIPNKRWFSDLEKGVAGGFGGGGKSIANVSNPINKRRTGNTPEVSAAKATDKDVKALDGGSQRPIISPIEAIIENTDKFVKAANRNKAMQQFYKLIAENPDDLSAFATVIKKDGEPLPGDIEDLVDVLTGDLTKSAATVFKVDKDNIVRVMVGGQPARLKINDKATLESLLALGPQTSGMIIDGIGKLTSNFKMVTTGVSPTFSILRNAPRDFVQAFAASKTTNNPIEFAADYVSAMGQILKRGGGADYQLFKSLGGGHSSSVAADRNLVAASKRAISNNRLSPKETLGRGWDKYGNVLNAVESAPRLAEFNRIRKSGGSNERALFEANDITVNFKRKGKLGRDFDKVFPYFNAALQGMDKNVRMYANPKTLLPALIKSFVSMTVPSIALHYVNANDPNYQKISEREKDTYWHVPKPDGTFWKIPKPREIGVIFSDIPERALRQFRLNDPAAWERFGETVRVAFSPPGISSAIKQGASIPDRIAGDTIFGPLVQLSSNKNFAGSPIVPGYLERLSPELQSDARTSSLSKEIANWPGVKLLTDGSPKKMDFLIKAYTGFLGQLGLPLITPSSGSSGTLERQLTSDPVYSNDISTEFYEYKNKLDQAYTDREYKNLPNWYDDSYRKYLNKVSSDMSDIRGLMREVQEDSGLGNQEKTEQLREMQEWLNEMGEEANANLRGVIPRK